MFDKIIDDTSNSNLFKVVKFDYKMSERSAYLIESFIIKFLGKDAANDCKKPEDLLEIMYQFSGKYPKEHKLLIEMIRLFKK